MVDSYFLSFFVFMALSGKKFFQHPKYIWLIWLGLSFINWWKEYFRDRYNNYKIFRQLFFHVLDKKNLYAGYPQEYFDSNHYGPVFAFIIAPFAILPDIWGSLLWSIFNAIVLYIAINRLPFKKDQLILIMLLCTIEMANAMWSNQFNSAAAAMIVLSFVLVEEKKDFQASFFIVLGTLIKLYGIVGLVFFLFSKRKSVFISGCVFWLVVMFLLPMLISSPEYIYHTYFDWFHSIVDKNQLNVSLDSSQDASIMGIIRRVSGNENIRNFPIIITGLVLYLLPFLRFSQYKSKEYRLLILASTLMFVILFSSSSEHPTYIYPMIGVSIWYILQGEKMTTKLNLFLLAFVILIGGLGPTDILGYPVRRIVIDYSLKALPYAIVWLFILRELIVKEFQPMKVEPIMLKV